MYKPFIRLAALLGALAVAFGAFGAHALRGKISDVAFNIFETGVRYHFYHVFALLFIAVLHKDFKSKWMLIGGRLFGTGILLFSGSLYILTYFKAVANPGYDWLGLITPFGGLALIAGWFCMFIGLSAQRSY